MCYYCHQVSYTSAAWNRLKKDPEDRFEAIRGPIEHLGGKFCAAYFASGNFDVLAITEFPDDVTPAAIAVAFADGGAVASIQTTRLLTAAQIMEARQKPEKPDKPVYSTKRRELAFTTTA
jgi:uncharacterized protein with GYD domain